MIDATHNPESHDVDSFLDSVFSRFSSELRTDAERELIGETRALRTIQRDRSTARTNKGKTA